MVKSQMIQSPGVERSEVSRSWMERLRFAAERTLTRLIHVRIRIRKAPWPRGMYLCIELHPSLDTRQHHISWNSETFWVS